MNCLFRGWNALDFCKQLLRAGPSISHLLRRRTGCPVYPSRADDCTGGRNGDCGGRFLPWCRAALGSDTGHQLQEVYSVRGHHGAVLAGLSSTLRPSAGNSREGTRDPPRPLCGVGSPSDSPGHDVVCRLVAPCTQLPEGGKTWSLCCWGLQKHWPLRIRRPSLRVGLAEKSNMMIHIMHSNQTTELRA